jgi:hypothetical protein
MSRMDWDKARRRDSLKAEASGGGEWWWIPGSGRCHNCREYGEPRAWNNTLASTLCVICVDAMGIGDARRRSPSGSSLARRAAADVL